MKTVLICAAVALGCATILYLRRRVRALQNGEAGILRSVTKLIFVTTQISALIWVYTSYGLAIYSTVRLGQVYTMTELSEPAIHIILGVGVLKVLENIFEHNEGPIFGNSKDGAVPDDHERNDL